MKIDDIRLSRAALIFSSRVSTSANGGRDPASCDHSSSISRRSAGGHASFLTSGLAPAMTARGLNSVAPVRYGRSRVAISTSTIA